MDLKVVETGNGGDAEKLGKDLAMVFGFENMPYLGMFGGNVQANTPSERIEGEQAFDWWGNNVFFPESPEQQYNSNTERTLNNVSLTSGNLLTIEEAVKQDLEFMSPFADITIDVSIIGVDKVKIFIRIIEPDNLQAKEYIFLWDAVKQSLEGELIQNTRLTEYQALNNQLNTYL